MSVIGEVWRQILEYFSAATQLGLTATPTKTKKFLISIILMNRSIPNSLRQGIDDGFWAPYRTHLTSQET